MQHLYEIDDGASRYWELWTDRDQTYTIEGDPLDYVTTIGDDDDLAQYLDSNGAPEGGYVVHTLSKYYREMSA